MLHFYTGSDRNRAREAMEKAARTAAGKKAEVVRITDAHTVADLDSALRGGGMFGGKRAILLEEILTNDEMRTIFFDALSDIAKSDEIFFLFEEKPDAATRKQIEKNAETSEKFDPPKTQKRGDIFVLANALSQADKKALWVAYQRALARDEAPEAIHGVLFWGAKQMALSLDRGKQDRGKKFVADLAELPHEARRKGFDLEYALEKYILSVNKS